MNYRLQDLIDIPQFQNLQNKLNKIYAFPSAIIDNDGNILTATAWQDVCTKFHRKHPQCEKDCIISDQYILSHLGEANPAVSYRCPRGLVDNATPIIIDGVHYGNFFTGQFFLEPPDMDFFRAQAKKYGFDEKAYLDAVVKVPVWTKEQLDSYLFFIKGLIAVISESGLKRLREIEARKKIEESEERANAILAQMQEGFWIVNRTTGRVIDANETMCRMLGYDRSTLLALSVSDVEVNDLPEIMAGCRKEIEETGSVRFESQLRCKDGSVIDVDVSVTCIPKRNLLFGFYRDITERKRAEEKIRYHESLLRDMGEIAKIGGWEFDSATGKGTWTDEVSRIHDLDPREGTSLEIGKSFYHDESRVRIESAVRNAIESGEPYDLVLEMVTAKGNHKWVHTIGRPVVENGKVVSVRGSFQDITERKRAEEALQKSEERYREVIEYTQAGYFLIDCDGLIQAVNKAWLRMHGYESEHEVIGRHFSMTQPPQFRDQAIQAVSQILNGESISSAEASRLCKDGSIGYHTFSAHPVMKDGKVVGLEGFIIDISHRKEMEKALRESEKKFRGLFENDLNGIALHEIVLDEKGNPIDYVFLDANSAFEKQTGLHIQEIIGKRVTEVIPGIETSGLIQRYGKVALTGEPDSFEMFFEPLQRHYHIHVYQVIERLFAVVFADITERRIIEEKLHESDERFQQLFDNMADGVAVYRETNNGRDFIIVDINRTGQLLSRVILEEVVGRKVTEIFPSVAEFGLLDVFRRVWRTGQTEHLPLTKYKDGRVVQWVENYVYKLPSGLIVTIYSDTSEKRQTEEALRRSEEKYRALVDNANEGIVVVQDGVLKFINHYFCELMNGYTADEVIGKPFTMFIHPDDRDMIYQNFIDRIQGCERPSRYSFRALARDGVVKWIEINVVVIEWNGKPATLNFLTDISNRKQAEQVMAESEARYRTYISNISDVIAILDKDLVIRYKSPNITRHFGWLPEDLVGSDGWKTIHPDDHEYIAHELSELLHQEGSTRIVQYRYLCKDGTYKYIELFAVNMVHDPIIQGILANYHDITEQRKNSQALRESEEKFRRAFKTSPDSVNINKLDGTYVEINDGFTQVTGYREEEIIGKTSQEIDIWAKPEDRKKLVAGLKAEGRVNNLQTEFRCKDGSIKTGIMSASIISIQNEPYILSITRDISDRIKLENQLLQAQKMESVARLAGGVAHDFNNMLGVILGHSELLLDQLDPETPLYSSLQEIRKAANRSADLTRQLLAFARKQTVSPKVLDLNDTVESMLKMLKRLIGENIELIWNPCKNIWPIKVDPSQIDQILANLCVNARDAINGVGKIIMETENKTFDEADCTDHPGYLPGSYVLLAVNDNGSGMTEDTQKKLFEPFYTTKEAGKGTGLGLATVHGIVMQNNGFINVYSELNTGTTFKIYLPRHGGTADRNRLENADIQMPRGVETILVVEDELSLLMLTTRTLERLGYTVLSTMKPKDAIRIAREHAGEIQLLITDVIMPEMNGRDMAEKLMSLIPNLKCLYMSGYTSDIIVHQGVLDEGLNFIQKPFTIQDMAAKVRNALDSD
jgi:two-component system, cell cycle sensor histidine kinase and response regulator CckA